MTLMSQTSLRIDAFDDLTTLPSDVLALFDDAERVDLQCGIDWFRNLVATVLVSSGTAWQLFVLRRNGTAVAVLPLIVERGMLFTKLRSLGNYYTTLFSPPMSDDLQPRELALLFINLRRTHRPLKALTFSPLDPAGHSTTRLRQALQFAGFFVNDFACSTNWYLPVQGSGNDYLAARPGELRSTLRRMGKKFAAAGGSLEVTETATSEKIDAFVNVYNLSWKRPEPYAQFVPGLVDLCAKNRWLRLGVAWLEGRPVAAQLWMVAHGKASIYKLAYDPAFKHLSPGSLLTAQLMQHVIDVDKVQEIDFLSGDDAYKKAWVSHRRERVGIVAYNPRSVAGLAGAVLQVLGHALRLMRLRSQRSTVR